MRRVAFAVPGDLATATGGYAYDRRMIAELQRLGWEVDLVGLGDGFPRPSAAQKAHAQAQLETAVVGRPLVIDGLALGVLPEAAQAASGRNPLIALVHHPLALETGLSPADAHSMRESERAALAACRSVIVTSAPTAKVLSEHYKVPAQRITVARPGTDRRAVARAIKDGPVQLLSIGALVPRKGFDVLIEALATLADLPWHLTIAGDRTRHLETAARLDADIVRHRLGERVDVLGVLPDEGIAALYESSDLFVLASRYEGYGMVFAEAVANGLPVVGTTAGAIPDTVPAGAGILVPPGDAAALATALRRLIGDADERRRLADEALARRAALPSWEQSAKLFSDAIEAAA